MSSSVRFTCTCTQAHVHTHIYIHHVHACAHTQLIGLLSMEFQLKVCFIPAEFRKEKHTAVGSSKDRAAEEDIGFRRWRDPRRAVFMS